MQIYIYIWSKLTFLDEVWFWGPHFWTKLNEPFRPEIATKLTNEKNSGVQFDVFSRRNGSFILPLNRSSYKKFIIIITTKVLTCKNDSEGKNWLNC